MPTGKANSFMVATCGLMSSTRPNRLGELPPQTGRILEAVLHRGEVARGEVDVIAGTGDRQGRRILAALIEKGVLGSDGPRAPIHLAFPATLAQRWRPGLFPDRINE